MSHGAAVRGHLRSQSREHAPWIEASVALYVLVGCFWLPVVGLQIRMRDMAIASAANGTALPPDYTRCYRRWFALGPPAFAGALVIFYLMVAKPGLWV